MIGLHTEQDWPCLIKCFLILSKPLAFFLDFGIFWGIFNYFGTFWDGSWPTWVGVTNLGWFQLGWPTWVIPIRVTLLGWPTCFVKPKTILHSKSILHVTWKPDNTLNWKPLIYMSWKPILQMSWKAVGLEHLCACLSRFRLVKAI